MVSASFPPVDLGVVDRVLTLTMPQSFLLLLFIPLQRLWLPLQALAQSSSFDETYLSDLRHRLVFEDVLQRFKKYEKQKAKAGEDYALNDWLKDAVSEFSRTDLVDIYTLSTFVSVSNTALTLSIDVEYYALGMRGASGSSPDDSAHVYVLHYAPTSSASALTGLPMSVDGSFAESTASITMSTGLNSSQWVSASMVTSISGETLYNFLDDMPRYVEDNPFYTGVVVYSESGDWDHYLNQGASSKAFVQWCLDQLTIVGAPMVPTRVGTFKYNSDTSNIVSSDESDRSAFGSFLRDCSQQFVLQQSRDNISIPTKRITRGELSEIMNQCSEVLAMGSQVNAVVKSTGKGHSNKLLLVPLVQSIGAQYHENDLRYTTEDPSDDNTGNRAKPADWILTLVLVCAFGFGIKEFVKKTGVDKACGITRRVPTRPDLYQRLQHSGELQLEQPASHRNYDASAESPASAPSPGRLSELESGFV